MNNSKVKYITVDEVRERLHMEACRRKRQTVLAKELEISDQYLSNILLGKKNPTIKILKFLNLRKVTLYEDISDSAGTLT